MLLASFPSPDRSRSAHRTPTRRRLQRLRPWIAGITAALLLPLSAGTGAAFASVSVTPAANPDLRASCGLDVALVLDASGSISSAGAESTVRNAAKAFADAFVDTDTKLGVISFSTNVLAHPKLPLTLVTSASIAGIKSEINSYNANGFTNWDDALRETKSYLLDSANNRPTAPDLVVFLTDGAPNTIGDAPSNGGQFSDASPSALDPAITDANAIKGTGAHMLSFGVGQSFTAGNTSFRQALAKVAGWDAAGSVSGVNLASEGFTPQAAFDPETTDVLFETDISKIQSTLNEVATSVCGGSLTISKQVSTPEAPDTYAPAGGWDFTATPSAPASSYSWVLPSTGAATSKTDTTAPTGNAQFQWRVTNVTSWNAAKTIGVVEAVHSGYQMQQPTCTKNGGTDVPVTGFNSATGAFSVDVGHTDVVTCTVRNKAVPQADLSVTKSIIGSAPYSLGTHRIWRVSVHNDGPSATGGVKVTDTLPAGVSFVSASADQGSFDSATGVWNVGTLDSGASAQLDVTVSLDQVGSWQNLAEVTAADEHDPDSTPNNCRDGANLEDDCATSTISITRDYELQVRKSAVTTGPLTLGDSAVFDIEVTNQGPSPAPSGVVVLDSLDAGLTSAVVVGAETDPALACSIDGTNLLTCTYAGHLAAEATTKVRVRGIVGAALDHATAIANRACASAPSDTSRDPVCDQTTIPLAPDLSITKVAAAPAVVTGGVASWTFAVTHAGGPTITQPFTVTDVVPAGLTTPEAVPGAGWDCGVVTITVTCTYTPGSGGLSAGETTTGVVVRGTAALVPPVGSTSPLDNTACVADSYNENDATPQVSSDGNDCATARITVQPQADLSITKSGPASARVDGTIDYSLTVANAGPSATATANFTDTLPSGLTSVSVDAGTGWDCTVVDATLSCTWTGSTIAAGNEFPAVVWTVAVGSALADETAVSNQACVTLESTDPNATDNCSTVRTPFVPVVDLGISKVADADSVLAGGTAVGWSVAVTNYGPSTATTVGVVESLPPGLTDATLTGTGWVCPDSPIASTGDAGVTTPCTYTDPLGVGETTAALFVSAVPGPDFVDGGFVDNLACTSDDIEGDDSASITSATGGQPKLSLPRLDVVHPDCALSSVQVLPVVDLAVTKSGPTSVALGGTATYTIALTNNGPSTATGPVVTDVLPDGLSTTAAGITAGDGWDCAVADVTVTCAWTGDPLPAGATTTDIVIAALVGPPLAAGASVTNQACTTDLIDEVNTPSATDDGNDCGSATTSVTAGGTGTGGGGGTATGAGAAAAASDLPGTGAGVIPEVLLAMALIGCGLIVRAIGARRDLG